VGLACLLKSALPALQSPPQTFDPVFSPHDLAVLPLFDMQIIDHNEEGRRIADEPTLFFMPHCEVELTENLLEANVQAGTLTNVVIIGNSFAQYRERWSGYQTNLQGQPDRKRPVMLLQLCEDAIVHETHLDDQGFPVAGAFNDMSLHTFYT